LLSEEEALALFNQPREDIIRAFRGLGKSYITAAFVIWRLMRNPRDEKVLVVSATGGKAKFHEVTKSKLLAYRAARKKQGLSDQTIGHEIKCVSAAYNCVKADYRVRVGLEFPMARPKGKPRYLTAD